MQIRQMHITATRVLFCCFAVIFIVFASSPVSAWDAESPIKVGTTAPFSGVYATPGQNQLEGIRMWVDDINARGALLGRKVKLVVFDDKSEADLTARLYQRLIIEEQVDLLIGPYSSELTLAASRVAEAHNFPMVAAGAASGKIWSQGFKNIFQVDAPARDYMNLLMESAKNKADLSRVALVYPDTDFSREVAEGVRIQAVKHAMNMVFDAEYRFGYTNFSGLVRRMLPTKPEIVIGATYLEDSVAFIREAKKQQLLPKAFAFTVGPALPEFGDRLGVDADGVIGVVAWMRSGRIPMAYDFSFRFKQKFGRNAGVHAAYGYGAGQVLEAGVRLAGSLVKDDVRKHLREMIFRSLLGNYRVDENGKQLGKRIYVLQWQKGRRRLVLPLKLSESAIEYPFKPWNER